MIFSFGDLGCEVEREDGTPCGHFGHPTEFEDGRTVQCCASCLEAIGGVRSVHSNYPFPVTKDDVHRWALDWIRRQLDAQETADRISTSIRGGCGPARREHPAYWYRIGTPVKHGYIEVELHGEGSPVRSTFKIFDLIADVQSGAMQASLLEMTS